MTYEEYKKSGEEILKNAFKSDYFTEEHFKLIQEYSKKENEFETKIDNLANDYLSIIPNMKIDEKFKDVKFIQYGYYAILEYCLKQIKSNDKNLMTGYVAVPIKKEKETNGN